MRIVIDMQGAQTASRTRGIGRYSMAFAESLVRNRGAHDVFLALNGLFPDTIMPIREAFADLLPRSRIRVWEAPGPLAAIDGNAERRACAALIREAFLASLDPDIVHVTSLFEGFADDAVVSIGALGGTGRFATAVTLYDLIPLHDPERFLAPNPAGEAHYRQCLAEIGRADLLLAISDFTARDAAARLALPTGRIVNVSSAHDAVFRPRDKDPAAADALRRRFHIPRNFILTSGTVEPHKNLDRLFAAFAALPPHLRSGHCIVLVGRFVGWQGDILAQMAAQAGLRKGEFVLTGYVSDDDLAGLYNACSLMVFPSRDEGFGLPALEAMACGAPTIGSRAASIPEIIGREDALFDPTDIADMARCIARGLEDAAFRTSLAEHAVQRTGLFSWDNTARAALAAMERTVSDKPTRAPHRPNPRGEAPPDRLRLALFVDESSGERRPDAAVATVVRGLSLRYQVTVVSTRRGRVVGAAASCEHPAWLVASAREVDRVLYWPRASGPSPDAIDLMQRVPGVLWLADALPRRARPHAVQMDEPAARMETPHGARVHRDARSEPGLPQEAPALDPDTLSVLRAASGVVFGSDAVADAEGFWVGDAAKRHVVPPPAEGQPEEEFVGPFFHAIESIYHRNDGLTELADALAGLGAPLVTQDLVRLSHTLARNFPAETTRRQFLVDVTHTSQNSLRTGIQRVVRATVLALLKEPPAGFRVEPVYLSSLGGRWHYRYARGFALSLLGCQPDLLPDDAVETAPDDVLHVLDLSGRHFIDAEAAGLHADLRRRGLRIYATIYDLLPVQIPERFPYGTKPGFEDWLSAIGRLDGALCISSAVASDYRLWRQRAGLPERHDIGWFHLGADIDNSDPTRGLPADAPARLAAFAARPTFLMVGTIEPRKGHLQAIAAFERLWRAGIDANLVIVGAEGWRGMPRDMRRTIPEILARLAGHPERDRRLFWLDGISDEYLEKVYAASTCLISPSEGEGFGLPLIEAARHRIPILARDLPVFREVAGDHAAYFSGLDAADLAGAVEAWLALHRDGREPRSEGMPWSTWQASARRIADLVTAWEGVPPAGRSAAPPD